MVKHNCPANYAWTSGTDDLFLDTAGWPHLPERACKEESVRCTSGNHCADAT